MRALVVDDEAPARRRMLRMLDRSIDIEETSEASTAQDALVQIRRRSPELVFLDVRMPGLDGLELAARCHVDTSIVFVTAYAEHAARAFELEAVDYLLKPVRYQRLADAIQRVKARRVRLGAVRATLEGAHEPAPRIIAYDRGEMAVVAATRVTRFRASDKYTAFVVDDREYLTEESLVSLEHRLARLDFFRVHRSELVRLSAVQSLRREDGKHLLRLTDGQQVPVGRRVARELRTKLRDR